MSATPATDRFAAARLVADAVLYEGYVLYPYRASARKNQLRWQFGVLVPPACSAADLSERSSVRTECVVDPASAEGPGLLTVRVRCLQVQHRAVEVIDEEGLAALDEPLVPWDEAIEQTVDLPPVVLLPPGASEPVFHVEFASAVEIEYVRTTAGAVVAQLIRHRDAVVGEVRVRTEPAPGDNGLVRVAVTVTNCGAAPTKPGRDAMVRRSLVAVHTMLAVDGGSFVSLIDPPDSARAAVDACTSDGTFPVLIGPGGHDDVLLSSPIILPDHPAVAPESPGDLYDATEIDEILALRVLTLTDDEKAEARATDARSAAIVDRVEQMPPELWGRLHGATRAFGVPSWTTLTDAGDASPGEAQERADVPWWDPAVDASVDPWTDTVVVAGHTVGQGARVRLHPSHRADAQDLFLAGRTGTVAGVFHDVDGGRHLAVTLDDDPAADLHEWQGRYRYFAPDEVEVLTEGPPTTPENPEGGAR